MLVGLVGKPSAGKSTFFKAATSADVLIAAYPFATIKPNHGVGYVKIEDIGHEFNVTPNPQKGFILDRWRFVPVELLDVAGLVEGASEGKGLGNQFLNDLVSADALIHVVDASGETDREGKEGQGNPLDDVRMLEKELDTWYVGIFTKVWRTLAKTIQVQKSDFAKVIAAQFSGLKVSEDDVKVVVRTLGYDTENVGSWDEEQVKMFAHTLRHMSKPMIIAANKCDKPAAHDFIMALKKEFPDHVIVPCSADSELALKEAAKHDLISYIPGEKNFEILGEVSEKQKAALENIQKNVLDVYGGTGVQQVLDSTVFDLLKYIGVFPASASMKGDSKGNILPDCFLVPKGSTALDFAGTIHSDLAKNFIKAIDARTKQAVGKEYVVKHRDALEIMTR